MQKVFPLPQNASNRVAHPMFSLEYRCQCEACMCPVYTYIYSLLFGICWCSVSVCYSLEVELVPLSRTGYLVLPLLVWCSVKTCRKHSFFPQIIFFGGGGQARKCLWGGIGAVGQAERKPREWLSFHCCLWICTIFECVSFWLCCLLAVSQVSYY